MQIFLLAKILLFIILYKMCIHSYVKMNNPCHENKVSPIWNITYELLQQIYSRNRKQVLLSRNELNAASSTP